MCSSASGSVFDYAAASEHGGYHSKATVQDEVH